jgi:hypothetical protein
MRNGLAGFAFAAIVAAPSPGWPANAPGDVSPLRTCFTATLKTLDALPPRPMTDTLTVVKDIDSFANVSTIENATFAVHNSPGFTSSREYNLYVAYDPQLHTLLAVQRTILQSYVTLYSVPSLSCALPQASLGSISTKDGFTIGSRESDVVAKLGDGNIVRYGRFVGHLYDDGCTGIMFTARDGRVVAIDSDPLAQC